MAAQAVVDAWEEHCESVGNKRRPLEARGPREMLWVERSIMCTAQDAVKNGPRVHSILNQYSVNERRKKIRQLLLAIHKEHRQRGGKDWRGEPKRTIGNLISRTNNTKDE